MTDKELLEAYKEIVDEQTKLIEILSTLLKTLNVKEYIKAVSGT